MFGDSSSSSFANSNRRKKHMRYSLYSERAVAAVISLGCSRQRVGSNPDMALRIVSISVHVWDLHSICYYHLDEYERHLAFAIEIQSWDTNKSVKIQNCNKYAACFCRLFSQPVFTFVERWSSKKFPRSGFLNNFYSIKLPLLPSFHINLFRICFRTAYVLSTTAIATVFPYFNQVLGLLGAFNFWPLAIYFPVEMYFVRNKVEAWTRKWVVLRTFSFVCFLVSVVGLIGSIEGISSFQQDNPVTKSSLEKAGEQETPLLYCSPPSNSTIKRTGLSFHSSFLQFFPGNRSFLEAVHETLGERNGFISSILTKISFYGTGIAYTVTTAISLRYAQSNYVQDQVSTQPVFANIEKWIAENSPNSRVVNKNFTCRLPWLPAFQLNLLRLCFRTIYVASTTTIAMIFPYFNQIIGLLGGLKLWTLTIYFPVEMYFKQRNVEAWSTKWIMLRAFSMICLLIDPMAMISDPIIHFALFKSTLGIARWLVSQNSWGVLNTLSSDLGGAPFGNVVSYSDGLPGEGSGIPYFYLTTLDPTAKNALQDQRSSFTISEYSLGTCGKKDPENPSCAKITLTGK
ncbi:hypothetical protein OIU85_002912, partial [Salix viminalis]